MKTNKSVLVIGAGVSGFSTGILLLKNGYDVVMWSKDLPENTTSAIAAAFWYPYLCEPKEKVVAWSKFTREYLEQNVMGDPTAGCEARNMYEFFDKPMGTPWWKDAVELWRHAEKSEIPDGYVDGYCSPMILLDTTFYLPWIFAQFKELGGKFIQRTVRDLDKDTTGHNVVVNCTGLGAAELCNDKELYPVRGQVVVVRPNGTHDIRADDEAHNNLAYIIPRHNDIILGGTAQKDNWDLEIDPADTREILRKAALLNPKFKSVEIIAQKVGLRPGRGSVRVEKEDLRGRIIIHNYGHGGAGYTISWGCANEVVSLIQNG